MSDKKHLGQQGEDIAVSFLENQGYKILERNFQNRYGEIDIVAQEEDIICFIEVKVRQSPDYGTPFDAISKSKQRKLINMALSYLGQKNKDDSYARFDVVGITWQDGLSPQIEILKDAFETS